MGRLIRQHLPLTLESTNAIIAGLLALQGRLDEAGHEHGAVAVQVASLSRLRDLNVLSGDWPSRRNDDAPPVGAAAAIARVAASG